jgi:hypothetical protein
LRTNLSLGQVGHERVMVTMLFLLLTFFDDLTLSHQPLIIHYHALNSPGIYLLSTIVLTKQVLSSNIKEMPVYTTFVIR